MRNTLQLGAACLAALLTVASVGEAVAQDQAPAAQNTINPNAQQAQELLKSLEGFAVQAVENFQPKVGDKVPPQVQTTPMPPKAQAALPEAKDHHVAKTDSDTVVIVDPLTRDIVSVITAIEGAQKNTSGQAPTNNSPDSQQ
jgi:hypothetical protein